MPEDAANDAVGIDDAAITATPVSSSLLMRCEARKAITILQSVKPFEKALSGA